MMAAPGDRVANQSHSFHTNSGARPRTSTGRDQSLPGDEYVGNKALIESVVQSMTASVVREMQDALGAVSKKADTLPKASVPIKDTTHTSIVDSIGRYNASHPIPRHVTARPRDDGHGQGERQPLPKHIREQSHCLDEDPYSFSAPSRPAPSKYHPNRPFMASEPLSRPVRYETNPSQYRGQRNNFAPEESNTYHEDMASTSQLLESNPTGVYSHSRNRGKDRQALPQAPRSRRGHAVDSCESPAEEINDEQARRTRTRQRSHQARRRSHFPTSDSDMSPDRGSSALLSHTSSQGSQPMPARRTNTRLPPFTGQEPWKVYYNTF